MTKSERKKLFAKKLNSAKTYVRNYYADFRGCMSSSNKAPEMVSQTTNYTCGPASIASAAKFYGIDLCERMLEKMCHAMPRIGSCHNKLTSVARVFLPVLDHGEGVYKGGFAIANIRNQMSGNGHYILMLGRRGEYLRYFCPQIGQTVVTHERDLDWQSSTGSVKNWAMNLESGLNTFRTNVSVIGQVC